MTTRKTLGLYANIRPCVSYHPYVQTKHPGMDVVIVRENEEDLYAGIEHRQTDEVYQRLKLISRPDRRRSSATPSNTPKRNNRKKVTCFTKDNIMKFTDGLFHKVFDEIGAEYPEFEKEHWIVDIGAAKMADTPEAFDVIVMPKSPWRHPFGRRRPNRGLRRVSRIREHRRRRCHVRGDPRFGTPTGGPKIWQIRRGSCMATN